MAQHVRPVWHQVNILGVILTSTSSTGLLYKVYQKNLQKIKKEEKYVGKLWNPYIKKAYVVQLEYLITPYRIYKTFWGTATLHQLSIRLSTTPDCTQKR